MAEKNTHLILESIKNKMNKFDQKPENKMADVIDDFDYVVPVKKEEPKEEDIVQDSELDTSILEQDTEMESEQEISDSEDSDYDDESSVKPLVEKVAANVQNIEVFEEFEEEDIENYEDEVDFDDDFEEEEEEELDDEIVEVEEHHEEVEISELPNESAEEPIFADLETEPKEKTEIKKEESVEEEEFNFDDFDFEEIKKESKITSEEKPAEMNKTANELDELEHEVYHKKEVLEEVKKEVKKEVHVELENELFGIKSNIALESALDSAEPIFSATPATSEISPMQEMPSISKLKVEEDDFSSFPELPPLQIDPVVEMTPKVDNQVVGQKGILIDENTVKI